VTRMVDCAVLGRRAPGLPAPPVPGELGLRIYRQVSREGWQRWLLRQQMIINSGPESRTRSWSSARSVKVSA